MKFISKVSQVFVVTAFVVCLGAANKVNAQFAADRSSSNDSDEWERRRTIEMLTDLRVKKAKAEHEEQLERASAIARLSFEIKSDLVSENRFNQSDFQRLERLEKLLRRTRRQAGGGDDAQNTLASNGIYAFNFQQALDELNAKACLLEQETRRTSRLVVSIPIIEQTTYLIDLLAYIKSLVRK